MHSRWIHIGIWVLGYVLFNLSNLTLGAFTAGTKGYWWVSLYGGLFNALLFYLNLNYLLPKYLNRSKWYLYIVLILSALFIVSLLETYADFLFIQYYPISYLHTFGELLEENILTHLALVLFLSNIFKFTTDWFRNERQKRQLEKEKLSAELSFLKAQINPHFLYNTLNNLFASAHKHNDPQTASGIAKLAKIMRYMLEESEADLVALEREIEYLRNYIALQKIRFSNDDPVKIELQQEGDVQGKMIAPLLLIPFVENAFQYGISLRSDSFIFIVVEVNDNQLQFKIQNSISPSKKLKEGHGIGLQNVRERLELLYPQKYQLQMKSSNAVFSVVLRIELSF